MKRTAADMAGKAIVLKVDTDRHPDLSARYNVRGIPNFVVLRSGQLVHQQPGVVDHKFYVRGLGMVAERSARGPRERADLLAVTHSP